MELPSAVASLVDDLRGLGFTVDDESWTPARASGTMELAASRKGVSGVRIEQDRGLWGVEVKIGSHWYDPFIALDALNDRPHERRATSHEERRAATVALVQQLQGDRREIQKIKTRHRELIEAYTRWAEGKSNVNPLR